MVIRGASSDTRATSPVTSTVATTLGGRLRWRVARLAERRDETEAARTLVFDVPGWPGHLAGQHVDVRLTAEDGYSTQRSYSVASAPAGDRVELLQQIIGERVVRFHIAAHDLNVNRGGQSEIENLADDVCGREIKHHSRKIAI